ncbi:hypothetical protein PUN28_006963 [Cardiocondyla obscurior]|uniref:Uncharacterized protein n=1 Tax=Cardiocondyla obscurior TaxID=286306 RepID=A0AAW2G5P8_9HYME
MEQSAKYAEALEALLANENVRCARVCSEIMYSSRAPVLSVCVRSVRGRKRYGRNIVWRLSVRVRALCNAATSRCPIAMHTHIRPARTDIVHSSTDKHLLCAISLDNLWLPCRSELSKAALPTPLRFFIPYLSFVRFRTVNDAFRNNCLTKRIQGTGRAEMN